jgi:DNA repair exonuclease SbcCD ATPase subunit
MKFKVFKKSLDNFPSDLRESIVIHTDKLWKIGQELKLRKHRLLELTKAVKAYEDQNNYLKQSQELKTELSEIHPKLIELKKTAAELQEKIQISNKINHQHETQTAPLVSTLNTLKLKKSEWEKRQKIYKESIVELENELRSLEIKEQGLTDLESRMQVQQQKLAQLPASLLSNTQLANFRDKHLNPIHGMSYAETTSTLNNSAEYFKETKKAFHKSYSHRKKLLNEILSLKNEFSWPFDKLQKLISGIEKKEAIILQKQKENKEKQDQLKLLQSKKKEFEKSIAKYKQLCKNLETSLEPLITSSSQLIEQKKRHLSEEIDECEVCVRDLSQTDKENIEKTLRLTSSQWKQKQQIETELNSYKELLVSHEKERDKCEIWLNQYSESSTVATPSYIKLLPKLKVMALKTEENRQKYHALKLDYEKASRNAYVQLSNLKQIRTKAEELKLKLRLIEDHLDVLATAFQINSQVDKDEVLKLIQQKFSQLN